ncbi:MAG: discoidin domain-containing protein [Sedimentisphaerales bacterium]|nr:discoidin domain-containing protein [Sedimentisphaerales bacterium]
MMMTWLRNSKWPLLAGLLAIAVMLPACSDSGSDTDTKDQSTEMSSGLDNEQDLPVEAADDNAPVIQDDNTAMADETDPAAAQDDQATEPPMATDQPTVSADGQKLAPLDIVLPKPMFVGTPTNIRVENLKKPLGKPRPPFLAPEGTTNVVLNKPVTSSDPEPIIGDLDLVTDGDKEGIDGSWVELGPMDQWVQIDLGKEHNIYAVLVWHYHRQARVYFDVIVQVSDDPDFITGVTTIFNNDIDNSSGQGIGQDMHYIETSEGNLIDAKGVKARYVRLYSNGSSANDQNHYTEVEVYGKPAA